jgi:hypothetical protein
LLIAGSPAGVVAVVALFWAVVFKPLAFGAFVRF